MLTINQNMRLDAAHDARMYAIERQQALLDPREVIEDSPAALDALVRYYLDGNKNKLDIALEQVMWDAATEALDAEIESRRMGYDIDD